MPERQQGKSRDWCFTINNYDVIDILNLDQLRHNVKYLLYGKEVGESGTPHLQGFIQYAHPTSFTRVKGDLRSNAHIETRRGTVREAIIYCKKDGQIFEFGEPQRLQTAKETQKAVWRELIEMAEKRNLEEIKEKYPGYYFRYYNHIRSLGRGQNLILDEIQHEWWWGPTGTGKSYSLWQQYPNHYQKELNKWWCGYNDEEVVAIEEWCPKNEVTASFLKIWADRYPFTAQIKGGSLQKIRPRKIIILSNYTIDQCFSNSEDREPIKRRFKEIHFPFRLHVDNHLSRDPTPLNPPHGGTGSTLHTENRVVKLTEEDLDMTFLDDI